MTDERAVRERIYLPIVFWIGVVALVVGLLMRQQQGVVAGVLLMAWGALLTGVVTLARRARARRAASDTSD